MNPFSTNSPKAPVWMLILLTLTLSGCDKLFEYSPYLAKVPNTESNTTAKNLHLLAQDSSQSDNFTFAVLSDCHYHYDKLATVIDHINQTENIQFVLFGGDIADQALLKEYELFHGLMDQLNKPYFVVIGNHDYNSNGELIYDQMFGERNFSFEYANNLFIIFDDIVWESNSTPDFNWLEQELTTEKPYNHIFVATHMPPSNDQFTKDMENEYRNIMANKHVSMSIHGHEHRYSLSNYYGDGVMYLVSPWLKAPEYCSVTCTPESIKVEIIDVNQEL